MQQTSCSQTRQPAAPASYSWLARMFSMLSQHARGNTVLRPEGLSRHLLRDLGLADQHSEDLP